MTSIPHSTTVPLDGKAPFTVAYLSGDGKYRSFREYKRWRDAAVGLVRLCRKWKGEAFLIDEEGCELASAYYSPKSDVVSARFAKLHRIIRQPRGS